ncbi:MAG: glycosyltransferase family 2 protein [Methylovirgula sp.]
MDFDIVIPTLNGARWLGQLLDAYRKVGVEPLYAVDDRSDDGSLALLHGRGARIALIHQDGLHVENGVFAQVSRFVDRDWILRLDDDEFPSRDLLKWAEKTRAPPDISSWWLPRVTLFQHKGGLKYSRIKTHYHLYPRSPLLDPQCRLYRHRDVSYITNVHTSGFESANEGLAPASAFFLHLDVLLRNPGERLAKMRRYETIKPRSTWKFAYHYLPDLFPAVQNPAPFKVRDFDALIASLPKPPRQSEAPAESDLKTGQVAAARYLRAWHLRHGGTFRRTLKDLTVRVLSRKPVAELLCTSARFLCRQTWAPRRLPTQLHRIGNDLYWRANLRAAGNAAEAPRSPAEAPSLLGKSLN